MLREQTFDTMLRSTLAHNVEGAEFDTMLREQSLTQC